MSDQATLARDLINHCRKATLTFASTAFNEFTTLTDEKLFKLADKSASNEEQTHYFEVRSAIARQHTDLTDRFDTQLNSAFDHYIHHRPTVSDDLKHNDDLPDQLSLVTDSDLEVSLALSGMSQKQDTMLAEALYALNQRLSVLARGKRLKQYENPVEPSVFADAFNQCIKPLDLDTKSQIIILKLFDQIFMPKLEALYDELNAYLVEQKVLPNLRFNVNKRTEFEHLNKLKQQNTPDLQDNTNPSDNSANNKAENQHQIATLAFTQRSPQAFAHQTFSNQNFASQTSTQRHQNTQTDRGSSTSAFEKIQALNPNPAQHAQTPISGFQANSAAPANQNIANQNQVNSQGLAINQSEVTQQELLQAIAQIQQEQPAQINIGATSSLSAHTTNDPDNNGPIAVVSFKASELAAVINHLQQKQSQQFTTETENATAESELVTPPDIEQDLKQELQKESNEKSIQKTDLDTIELVGLLFKYMLNEEHLPDKAKTLISYLHTPFLKIGLLDPDFFASPKHPARVLLNKLVDAGIHWLDPEKAERNKVFTQMKVIIQRVLKEFDDDISLLEHLAAEFSAFIDQHERRIKLAENRIRQSAKGEDRLKEIRIQVIEFLERKSDNIRLPKPVETLLFEPWASYLQFNLLRFGKQSQQWHDAVKVVDDLLWVIMPKHSQKEISQADHIQQSLPTRLENGFDTIGYSKEKSTDLIKAIALCKRLSAADITNQKADARRHAKIHSENNIPKKLKPYVDKLTHLDFGTWFVFNAKDKNKQLAKLVWYNVKTNHYMFINKLGQQIKVGSTLELAQEMADGTIAFLNDKHQRPFFENALESILKQMQLRSKKRNNEKEAVRS